MTRTDTQEDLAGQPYWDENWREGALPPRFDPSRRGWRNHVVREFHRAMTVAIAERRTAGRRLLEIGCARSSFLPYMALDFGFQVEGLDYSPAGAAQASRILARDGVDGVVTCGDMFLPPEHMVGQFDVVLSYGVMEHFRDTANALRAAAKFLAPGGVLITLVPNLAGLTGWVQKYLNPRVYEIHVPLDHEQLGTATTDSGLELISSAYVTSSNFGIVNLAGTEGAPTFRARRRVQQLLSLASIAGWLVDEQLFTVPRSRAFSGYVMSVGRKPRG